MVGMLASWEPADKNMTR